MMTDTCANSVDPDLIMKYFLWSFSLLLIQEGQLPISDERMCTNTGLSLSGLSLARKSVVR